MRDFDIKVDNTAPASSGRLPAAQFNAIANELENAVTAAGIVLDPSGSDTDLYMLGQAMSKTASGGVFCVDSGGVNAFVLSAVSPFRAPKALFKGMRVIAYAGAGNNSTATLNAYGLGIKPFYTHTGAAMAGGETVAQRLFDAVYDPDANSGNGAWKLAPWANQLLLGASSVVNNTYVASLPYVADTGSTNAVVGVYSPAITSLAAGNVLLVKIAHANTGATTFKANALSAVPMVRVDGTALRPNDIVAGMEALLLFDGTSAQLLNPNPMSQAPFAAVVFDGTTNPPTIKGSRGVDSVTKGGTGKYTINLTAGAPTNFVVAGTSTYLGDPLSGTGKDTWMTIMSRSSSSVSIAVLDVILGINTLYDSPDINMIFVPVG